MIVIDLSEMLKKRNMTSKELVEIIGITETNLSILRSNKAKAIRFSTLDAICKALDCVPGDILKYEKDGGLHND
jgi:putative transcriptional regulator